MGFSERDGLPEGHYFGKSLIFIMVVPRQYAEQEDWTMETKLASPICLPQTRHITSTSSSGVSTYFHKVFHILLRQ